MFQAEEREKGISQSYLYSQLAFSGETRVLVNWIEGFRSYRTFLVARSSCMRYDNSLKFSSTVLLALLRTQQSNKDLGKVLMKYESFQVGVARLVLLDTTMCVFKLCISYHEPMLGGVVGRLTGCFTGGPAFELWHGIFLPWMIY